MSGYSPLACDELTADVQRGDVPANVLIAAHSLFKAEHGRDAKSDEEALTYVQRMVEEKKRAEAAQAAASCASGVPPNVIVAANNLFVANHGRQPASVAEALSFAQTLAQSEASIGGSAGGSGFDARRGGGTSDANLPPPALLPLPLHSRRSSWHAVQLAECLDQHCREHF